MLDILQQHLAENATPELRAAIDQAHQVFERIGLENYEPGYQEILMIDGSEVAGTKDTLVAITELTQALLRKILADHTITVVEDTPLEMLIDLVTALLDLQAFSDLATLHATASLDGLPNEVFCELLALVSAHTVPELMAYVDEVSYFLIKRVKELAEREPTPEQAAEQAERVARHRAVYQRARAAEALPKQLTVTDAVLSGMSMGLPFFSYIQRFGWELQRWDVKRSGAELLAMALISRDGIDNPRAMIQQHIEQYVPGLDRVTQIDVDIADRLMKINHHEQA